MVTSPLPLHSVAIALAAATNTGSLPFKFRPPRIQEACRSNFGRHEYRKPAVQISAATNTGSLPFKFRPPQIQEACRSNFGRLINSFLTITGRILGHDGNSAFFFVLGARERHSKVTEEMEMPLRAIPKEDVRR